MFFPYFVCASASIKTTRDNCIYRIGYFATTFSASFDYRAVVLLLWIRQFLIGLFISPYRFLFFLAFDIFFCTCSNQWNFVAFVSFVLLRILSKFHARILLTHCSDKIQMPLPSISLGKTFRILNVFHMKMWRFFYRYFDSLETTRNSFKKIFKRNINFAIFPIIFWCTFGFVPNILSVWKWTINIYNWTFNSLRDFQMILFANLLFYRLTFRTKFHFIKTECHVGTSNTTTNWKWQKKETCWK